MDCGIPFCNNGCPLGNLIPDWNDLVYREHWRDAIDRLHATNNFPEFTGRLCPAPCEAACVLGINADPVDDQAGRGGDHRSSLGRGLGRATAAERQDGQTRRRDRIRPGRLGGGSTADARRPRHRGARAGRSHRWVAAIRHSRVQDGEATPRRVALAQMEAEGTEFRTNATVGDSIDIEVLLASYDAIVLAAGATAGRDLPIPGRELLGIHQAMEYLPLVEPGAGRRHRGRRPSTCRASTS